MLLLRILYFKTYTHKPSKRFVSGRKLALNTWLFIIFYSRVKSLHKATHLSKSPRRPTWSFVVRGQKFPIQVCHWIKVGQVIVQVNRAAQIKYTLITCGITRL